MKILPAFLVSLAILVASCSDKPGAPEGFVLKQDDPAVELYYKYAEDTNLTVAYMGDFFLNGIQIDALMLRADFEDDWNQLKSEFGMLPRSDSSKTISVGLEINTDFIVELGLDTITDLNQVGEERHRQMNAIIADRIRGVVNNFPAPDTVQTTEDYINTLAEAIGHSLLNGVLVKNGAAPDEEITIPDGLVIPDSTMRDARDYGHHGYITAANDKGRTLWLFFYDNQEECDNILKHIKEDVLVGDQRKH